MTILADDLFDRIRNELRKLAMPGVTLASIDAQSLLIDDLGLDSMKFVDLTVALESILDVPEFPMQHWVDDQVGQGLPLTVQGLVTACRALIERREMRHPALVG